MEYVSFTHGERSALVKFGLI